MAGGRRPHVSHVRLLSNAVRAFMTPQSGAPNRSRTPALRNDFVQSAKFLLSTGALRIDARAMPAV